MRISFLVGECQCCSARPFLFNICPFSLAETSQMYYLIQLIGADLIKSNHFFVYLCVSSLSMYFISSERSSESVGLRYMFMRLHFNANKCVHAIVSNLARSLSLSLFLSLFTLYFYFRPFNQDIKPWLTICEYCFLRCPASATGFKLIHMIRSFGKVFVLFIANFVTSYCTNFFILLPSTILPKAI